MNTWIGGGILRALRLGVGHSNQSVAAVVEVDRSYVSRLERGERRPSLAMLEKWCAACRYETLEPRALAHRLNELDHKSGAEALDLTVAHALIAYVDLRRTSVDVVPTLLDALRPSSHGSAHGPDFRLYRDPEAQAGLVWLALATTHQRQPERDNQVQLTDLLAVLTSDATDDRAVIQWWVWLISTTKHLPLVRAQIPDPLQARLAWLWDHLDGMDHLLIVQLAQRLARTANGDGD